MFRNVLAFFEKAGARYGQSQWKVSIGDELVDFRRFEEFLEHWDSIDCEFDLPALDRQNAFILNSVRFSYGGNDHLAEGDAWDRPIVTGVPDADFWLAEYYAGRYAPFPRSLSPEGLPAGLDDAARVLMAALSVIHEFGWTRDQMQPQHRARSYRSIAQDAFHPWTIAQSETDHWLCSQVMYLANVIRKPEEERKAFGARLIEAYSGFPRRRFNAKIDISNFERLLSLPAWKKRYELYGVWVATEVIDALKNHVVIINHNNGELKFAFAETRITDIESSRPKLCLISERRSPLANPTGESRTAAVQPDYGIWMRDLDSPKCILIVEVKHYKKRSRRNFGAALIDYARAHEQAMVVLVNYGPVGADFTDMLQSVKDRCKLIGYFNPENSATQGKFQDLVRECVGDVVTEPPAGVSTSAKLVAIDTSRSMQAILHSDQFWQFIEGLSVGHEYALVDQCIRGFEQREHLRPWFDNNELGAATSLSVPVSELLAKHETIILIAYQDRQNSLRSVADVEMIPCSALPDMRVVQIRRAT